MQRSFKNPAELAQLVDGYFTHCEETRTERTLKNGDVRVRQEVPSMVGLAVYLDIASSTLYLYAEGKYDDIIDKADEYTETYSEILSRARDRIELATLTAATQGDTDSRVALSRLARFGYSTKVETESRAELTVRWEGVDTADAEAWGK